MEVAASLFAKKGFNRTTTKELARQAGVSEAMIFKHFSSKEKLYSSILDLKARQADPLTDIKEAAANQDDQAIFEGLAKHYFFRVEKDPDFIRLLLFSALEHHKLADSFVNNHVLRIHQFLSQYIEGRIAQGTFRKVDPLTAARSFIGMVSHHLLSQEVFGMKKGFWPEKDEAISTFVTIFLKGIQP